MFFLSSKFWKDLLERAVATFFEGLLVILGASAQPLGILDVGWKQAVSVAGLMAFLSICKSFAASFRGDPDSASLVE